MSAETGERGLSVASVIERHRQAFAALERYTEIVDQLNGTGDEWVSEQLEISRLEDEVEVAAIAMTTVSLPSIEEVVKLLSYIDEFSRSRRTGYLLWPETVTVKGGELPWCFAVLRSIRNSLAASICEK